MTKKKTYVLTVSTVFPKTHQRSGEETGFVNKIARWEKIHTIRGNYELWKKRIDKINNVEAVLSVRVWTGKPYQSKQREVFVFEKVGVEKIILDPVVGWYVNDIHSKYNSEDFAKNDGLGFDDFRDWFKGTDWSKPMAIIHFSNFRYSIKY